MEMEYCVQHVTKKSSDELLRKFAELDSGRKGLKRRKRLQNTEYSSPVVERRRLIQSPAARKCVLLKNLGIVRRSQQLKLRDNFTHKSLLGAIHKTWRRTVEGATKVLLEKHYNAHRRLINDSV